MRPQVGNVIHNKYRLLRLIGDGGMGAVFEARHEVLGTTVALKFLHVELSRRPGLVQRFLQEARVSAQIQSPNVVRVTDVDQTPNGLAFIVMELLDGKTLQALYEELYRAGQRLSYADALEYGMQMLEGVSAAHKTGIVHRDLKPDNVMITRGARGDAVIKLLDFGIAKLKVTGQFDRGLTRPGVIMGTPEYMAPEQAYSADAVDSRADIFSLGVIIFEMLAGRRPVGGDEPQQIASAYLSGQVADLGELFPECPPDLADAVHKAMAPLAKDRFPSIDAFRSAIEPFWMAIRPPPSVHTSHPSISFARLTPVPAPRSSEPGRGNHVSSKPAPVSPAPRAVEPQVPAPAASRPDHVLAVGPSGRHAPVAAEPLIAPVAVSAALPPPPPLVAKLPPPPALVSPAPAVPDLVPQGERRRGVPDLVPPAEPRRPSRHGVAKTVLEDLDATKAASPSIDGGATAEGAPPVDSQVPSREPTPLGGFVPYRLGGETPAPPSAPPPPVAAKAKASAHDAGKLGTMKIPVHDPANPPAGAQAAQPRSRSRAPAVAVATPAAPAARADATPAPTAGRANAAKERSGSRAASLLGSAAPNAALPGTMFDGAPGGVNGSGTAEAAPLFVGGLGAGTAEAAPLFVGESTSGEPAKASASAAGIAGASAASASANGETPRPDGSGGTAAGASVVPGGGTAVGPSVAPGGGTAVADKAYVASPGAPPKAKAPGKARKAAPLALVLLLAAGVSAAVVGGVYFAHHSASAEEHASEDPIVQPTPTSVQADPQPGPEPPPAPAPTAGPGKNVLRTVPGPHPGGPHPQLPGSGKPQPPQPPGSAKPPSPDQPPNMPPGLPIIIPSGFPFPFPGQPPGQGPGPQPPQDPSGSRHRRGGPPLEPIPRPPPGGAPESYLPNQPVEPAP